MAQVLVGLGALSLVAAVAVFAAVSWNDLAEWAKGGLIVALTGVVGCVAVSARRRGLGATAEALGAVTVALSLADVHVAQVGLDSLVEGHLVWAAGLAVLAVAGVMVGRGAGLTVLRLAGTATAFFPLLVLAAPDGGALLTMVLIAVQGLVAMALALPRPIVGSTDGSTSSEDQRASGPVERPVAVVGGLASAAVSAVGAFGLALSDIVGDSTDGRAGPLLVLGGLAVGLVSIGIIKRRTTLVCAGSGLAFLPGPLAVVGVGSTLTVAWILTGQVVVAVAVVAAGARLSCGEGRAAIVRSASGVAAAMGTVSWVLAGLVAVAVGAGSRLGRGAEVDVLAVVTLLTLALLAAAPARLFGWRSDLSGSALSAASVTALAAVALGVPGGADVVGGGVLITAGAMAVVAAFAQKHQPEQGWVAVLAWMAAIGGSLTLVPLVAVLDVVGRGAEAVAGRNRVDLGSSTADWLSGGWPHDQPIVGASVGLYLLGLALAAVAVTAVHRRAGQVVGLGTGIAVLLLAPVALDSPVWAALGAYLVAFGGLLGAVTARPRDLDLVAGLALVSVVGFGVASVMDVLAVGWIWMVALAAVALAIDSVRRDESDLALWVGAAAVVTVGGTGLMGWVLEWSQTTTALAVAAAAAAASVVAPVLECRPGPRVTAGVTLFDLVVGGFLAAGVLTTGSVDGLSVGLVILAAAAAVAALRPTRRPLWLVASGAVVALVWVRLGVAGVDVVEAWTLPLAAWALVVGLVSTRIGGHGSWVRWGAALVLAVGPTTLVAVTSVDLWRTVAVVAVGLALAVWGSTNRLQAPLAVGGGALVVVGLRHLAPVAADAPRYLAFAVAGLVLVGLGATFEQRRRDLRSAIDSFGRLG